MDGVAAKPISPAALVTEILRLSNREPPGASAGQGALA
jgi:hypothetical protein